MEIQPGVEAAVYDWDTGLELDRNTAGGVTSGTYSTSLLEVSQGLEAIAGAMQTITSSSGLVTVDGAVAVSFEVVDSDELGTGLYGSARVSAPLEFTLTEERRFTFDASVAFSSGTLNGGAGFSLVSVGPGGTRSVVHNYGFGTYDAHTYTADLAAGDWEVSFGVSLGELSSSLLLAVGDQEGYSGTFDATFTLGPVPDAVVPEPATLALMGIGLTGFAAARRRRKARPGA